MKSQPGIENARSKLNDAKVRAIRKAAAQGASYRALAREHGVSHVTVLRCVQGTTWTHVK